MIPLPGNVKKFASVFRSHGYDIYLVGGSVRNSIAGLEITDYDFTTDATPEEVISIFKKVIPTGIQHGTVTVLYGNDKFEVTTFRIESGYSDSRRPDSVSFTPSLEEDLKRRDFTINAIAYDINSNTIIDPHNGREDILKGIIRAIGNPIDRFHEDSLRILRACRFTAQLGYTIEEKTFLHMQRTRKGLAGVSIERVQEELSKIIHSPYPVKGFETLRESGTLELILPELHNCIGVDQKGFHSFDVYFHSIYSLEGSIGMPKEVQYAALFHDIGKPEAFLEDDNGIHFHNHEHYSVSLVQNLFRRLKLRKDLEKKVITLIQYHMFHYLPEWSDAAVRRFISRVGLETIPLLFQLRKADQYGMARKTVHSRNLDEFSDRISRIVSQDAAFSIADLAVNGNDLASTGIPKGPIMGTILKELLDTVLDDPSLNKRGTLLNIGKQFYESRLDL